MDALSEVRINTGRYLKLVFTRTRESSRFAAPYHSDILIAGVPQGGRSRCP
jgi:hypothetical protein